MVTAFPFMVVVLSMLRQGLGLQQAPPNMLIVTLTLFLTGFCLGPVFARAGARPIGPALRAQAAPDARRSPQRDRRRS